MTPKVLHIYTAFLIQRFPHLGHKPKMGHDSPDWQRKMHNSVMICDFTFPIKIKEECFWHWSVFSFPSILIICMMLKQKNKGDFVTAGFTKAVEM